VWSIVSILANPSLGSLNKGSKIANPGNFAEEKGSAIAQQDCRGG